MSKTTEAKVAKVALRTMIQGEPWLRGIGISKDAQGVHITVRVAQESFDDVQLPVDVQGVRVVKEIGDIAELREER